MIRQASINAQAHALHDSLILNRNSQASSRFRPDLHLRYIYRCVDKWQL